MSRDRVYFILAAILFVPATVMGSVGLFLPHYAHPLSVASFAMMIGGIVFAFLGFTNAS